LLSSKHFFFEKKKQKTFMSWDAPFRTGTLKDQKFFGSFFQKRTSFLSFLHPCRPGSWAAGKGRVAANERCHMAQYA
jgi:hypothetical protein